MLWCRQLCPAYSVLGESPGRFQTEPMRWFYTGAEHAWEDYRIRGGKMGILHSVLNGSIAF